MFLFRIIFPCILWKLEILSSWRGHLFACCPIKAIWWKMSTIHKHSGSILQSAKVPWQTETKWNGTRMGREWASSARFEEHWKTCLRDESLFHLVCGHGYKDHFATCLSRSVLTCQGRVLALLIELRLSTQAKALCPKNSRLPVDPHTYEVDEVDSPLNLGAQRQLEKSSNYFQATFKE